MQIEPWMAEGIITVVLMILWYLLRQKDARQEGHIKELYSLHKEDAERLQLLEVKLAEDYHKKEELNGIVNSLRKSLADGIQEVTRRLDDMNKLMMQHLIGSNRND